MEVNNMLDKNGNYFPYTIKGYKTVSKGWGYELHIVNNDNYCGKILHIDPGKKLSLHYHEIKDETFFIKNGSAEIIYYNPNDKDKAGFPIFPNLEEKEKYFKLNDNWSALYAEIENGEKLSFFKKEILLKNNVFHIPVGVRHTVKAIGGTYLEIFEISTHDDPKDSKRVIKGD